MVISGNDTQVHGRADGVKPAPAPVRTIPAGIVLTPDQLRRRRRRNLAIGFTVGFLALLFYVVTIVKLGPGVLNRPL